MLSQDANNRIIIWRFLIYICLVHESKTMKKIKQMNYKKRYLFFLVLIFSSILIAEILVHRAISIQIKDGHIFNVSGRQRMLSQNITKKALEILLRSKENRPVNVEKKALSELLEDWDEKHQGLMERDPVLGLGGKNSIRVKILYDSIQPFFNQMLFNGQLVVTAERRAEIEKGVQALLASEPSYLKVMDQIAFQYDLEAKQNLNRLQKTVVGVGIFTFLSVLLVLMLVINPLVKNLMEKHRRLTEQYIQLEQKNSEISNKKSIITQQKEALETKAYELSLAKQRAEAIAMAKANFLSSMSHEIRTPLNGIIGITNILLEEDPTPSQREQLNTLRFSTQNLVGIINDILDYSKIEAGKLELERLSFNLKESIQELYNSLNPLAQKKALRFDLTIDEDLPQMVIGDQVRLNQILTNLLGNAIKFTAKGFISMEVRLLQKERGEALIFFAVEDSGIGIPPEKQKAIFDSFAQVESDMTRKYGGTGLGLAITKKLVQLYQSEIQLKSEVGKGSKFFFTIRLEIGQPVLTKPKNIKVSIRSLSFKGAKKVLLVDDNLLNLSVAKRFLKYWDLEYDIAHNGQEAIELVQKETYSLVLMDLQMPVMDGFTAVEIIRSWEDPQYQSLPIIALSASAIASLREKAINMGMNDFLTKPYQPKDLYLVLEKHLSIDNPQH